MDYQDEFDRIEDAAADRRRQQNFDDLQNELSGNDVGRISRFLSPEARALIAETRNGKKSGKLSALDLALMNNTQFAKAYGIAMETLAEAEDVTERVLHRLETQLSDLGVQLKDTQAKYQNSLDIAATLDDGTKIFRDADGRVWDEHGALVDDAIAASVEWTGLELSREMYLQQRKALDDLSNSIKEVKDSIHEIRVYQTDVLGNVRAELSDANHSGLVEDVNAAKDRIINRMPASLRDEYKPKAPELEADTTLTFSVAEPNLGG